MTDKQKQYRIRQRARKAERLARELHTACAVADAYIRTYSEDRHAGRLSQDLREAAGLSYSMTLTLRMYVEAK